MNKEEKENFIVEKSENIILEKQDPISVSELSEIIDISSIEILKTLSKYPDKFFMAMNSSNYDEKKGPLFGHVSFIDRFKEENEEELFEPEEEEEIRSGALELLNNLLGVNKQNVKKEEFDFKSFESLLKKIHLQLGNVIQLHGVELFSQDQDSFNMLNNIQTSLTALIVKKKKK